MNNKFRTLGNGRIKIPAIPALSAVAFAAACSSEPMSEPKYDLAKPLGDMTQIEQPDLKPCQISCVKKPIGGQVGSDVYTLNDAKTGKSYTATVMRTQKDGQETSQVSFAPPLPPEVTKNRFKDQQGGLVLDMNIENQPTFASITLGIPSAFGTLKLGEKLNTETYEVEFVGAQKHNDQTFAILNFSQSGNTKSATMEAYGGLDLFDGCNYSAFHAFEIRADLVALNSYIQLYSLFAKIEIKEDWKLVINGKQQDNVVSRVQSTTEGISGYTLTYQIGSEVEICN